MRTIGGYEVHEELGRGRWSIVYRARHVASGRDVALKLVTVPAEEQCGRRFLAEARCTRDLAHPNLVTVHEYGACAEGIFLALEPAGRVLASAIATALPPARALRIARDVAAALDYLHARGIVHRDVRPANIFMRDDGTALLGEPLGCAQLGFASDGVERMRGQLTHYDSPEQLAQQDIDGRSDLYSLGVVLYRMLAGTLPFAGEPIVSAMNRMTGQAQPLPTVLAAYQPLVSALLARACDDRPPDGATVVRAIDRTLATTELP